MVSNRKEGIKKAPVSANKRLNKKIISSITASGAIFRLYWVRIRKTLVAVVVGLEVVSDSDIDRFRAVVVEEFSVVGFSDSDSGSVAIGSELIDNLAGAHTGDGAHTVESVSEGLTVEDLTEDIELFD